MHMSEKMMEQRHCRGDKFKCFLEKRNFHGEWLKIIKFPKVLKPERNPKETKKPSIVIKRTVFELEHYSESSEKNCFIKTLCILADE